MNSILKGGDSPFNINKTASLTEGNNMNFIIEPGIDIPDHLLVFIQISIIEFKHGIFTTKIKRTIGESLLKNKFSIEYNQYQGQIQNILQNCNTINKPLNKPLTPKPITKNWIILIQHHFHKLI